jgi:hypothetical protein
MPSTSKANFKSWLGRHFTLVTVLAGLIFALSPTIVEHFWHTPPNLIQAFLTLVERSGDALLIAAALWAILERSKHDEFLQDLGKKLLVNVFGSNLPEKLRKHIQAYFNFPFVRTTWDIEYRIDLQTETADHLRLFTSSQYVMHNHSSESQEYEFIYEVEKSQCNHSAEITKMVAGNETFTGARLAGMVESTEGYLRFKRLATSQQFEAFWEPVPSGDNKSFTAMSVECFRNVLVSPFWAAYPVLDATFSIYYDRTKFHVYFEITGDDVRPPEDIKDETGNAIGQRWKTAKPILPGQGFFVRASML